MTGPGYSIHQLTRSIGVWKEVQKFLLEIRSPRSVCRRQRGALNSAWAEDGWRFARLNSRCGNGKLASARVSGRVT